MQTANTASLAQNPDITLVAGSIKGAMRNVDASSRDLWMVKRSAIRIIEHFNVRVRNGSLQAHIRQLADSMKANGFKPEHPLGGYVSNEDGEQVIYLTDGHNRLEAFDIAVAEGAEMDELPMVVSGKGRSLEDITVGLVISNSGKPLDTLEKAFVCKRLASFNWDSKKIAQRLGISTSAYVDDLLMLAGAPSAVIEKVAAEEVAAAVAIDMLKQHGSKVNQKIEEGIERAKANGKTKLTKQFTQDPGLKFAKRNAGDLFHTVQAIQRDPSFEQLSAELKDKVKALIEAATKPPQKKEAKTPKAPKAAKGPKASKSENTTQARA